MAATQNELLTFREVARRTGVNVSSVCRYAQRHPEVVAETGARPKIRLAEYLEHRRLNGAVSGDDVNPSPPPPRGVIRPLPGTFSDDLDGSPLSRLHNVRAQLAAIELAERKAQLTRRADVQAAIGAMVDQLRPILLTPDEALAARLMGAEGAGHAAMMLARHNRALLTGLVESLAADVTPATAGAA